MEPLCPFFAAAVQWNMRTCIIICPRVLPCSNLNTVWAVYKGCLVFVRLFGWPYTDYNILRDFMWCIQFLWMVEAIQVLISLQPVKLQKSTISILFGKACQAWDAFIQSNGTSSFNIEVCISGNFCSSENAIARENAHAKEKNVLCSCLIQIVVLTAFELTVMDDWHWHRN